MIPRPKKKKYERGEARAMATRAKMLTEVKTLGYNQSFYRWESWTRGVFEELENIEKILYKEVKPILDSNFFIIIGLRRKQAKAIKRLNKLKKAVKGESFYGY